MSFIKIDNNNFEYSSINLRPSIHFLSSSIDGNVTGSEYVSPIRSKVFKKFFESIPAETDSQFNYNNYLSHVSLKSAVDDIRSGKTNIYGHMNDVLNAVNQSSYSDKMSKTIDIFRFDQPVFFTKNKNIKNIVKNNLMTYHKHRYDNCSFVYSNYHTLNFFTTENIPTGSCLIYTNLNNRYDLPDSFSLNFWVNPRYSKDSTLSYNPGTILHISSSLCVSLITGSSTNEFNEIDKFKILLQLSHSADIHPGDIDILNLDNVYPRDLIFTSSDYLSLNNWHNVSVQWSNLYNNSTGSLFIDDFETNFHIPSSSLSSIFSPSGIIVGNHYQGTNDNLSQILNNDLAIEEGFDSSGDSRTSPVINDYTFSSPLHAEIHDIKLFDKFLSNESFNLYESERESAKNRGVSSYKNLKFYVPPFFYPDTPARQVHVTPFQSFESTTDDPLNVAFSLGINGKLINLENFVREFVSGSYPRLLGLFPGTMNQTVENILADDYVYHTGSHIKRNMTILPNDNGLYSPNYYPLSVLPLSRSIKFYSDGSRTEGIPDYSIISIDNLIPESAINYGIVHSSGSFFDAFIEASSNNAGPGVQDGADLTIAQRTRERASNEIVIYDISNLYYGNRIHPGSFEINDQNLTGSDGKIKIKIKDNERGGLYRADALTKHAKWNNVGNVLYDEGIAIIKTPHLFYFGKDETDIKFKGEQNIHTMIFNVPVYKNTFNSSSNPSFSKISPSSNANDDDISTLYVTTVNIHDDNLNIIMKANFSQPIFKTEDDEFVIRLKEDF